MTTNSKALNRNAVQGASELVSVLSKYPCQWRFVPINDNKQPLGREWQQSKLGAEAFQKALADNHFSELRYQPKGTEGTENRKPVPLYWMKAIGVLCGTPSGGLLCFDHDGESADVLVEKLSGMPVEDALPPSPTVTSGKTGRYQILYYVPEMYWGVITSKRILTGAKVWNSFKNEEEGEQIEFRWDGLQSVILGVHPETGSYSWVEGRSPLDLPVAEAPTWMIERMLEDVPDAESAKPVRKAEYSITDPVPLENCIAHKNRERLAGVDKGGRNNSGAALARDLIATERYLSVMGHRWTGNARQLFDEFCSRCTPPIPDKEADIIWKSAEGSNPTPACNKYSSDGVENCVKAWQKSKSQWIEPAGDGDRPETVKELSDKKPILDAIGEKYLKFREAIMLAMQIPNQAEKEFALEEIAINFRKSKEFMKRLIDELEARRKPVSDEEDFVDVVDLLNMPMEGVQYLIDDFIPRGESILLTAKAKVGKSLLAYEAAYAVASGSNFLNKQAHQGRVLIIQTEEGKVELHKRLNTRGFDTLPRGQVHTLRRFKVHRDIPKLEAKLAEFRPSLVIIDSLRKVSAGSGVDENKAEFANPVYEIADIVRGYGASCIFIHHDKKDKEATGIDAGAGTSALPGAVWGIWRLLRTSQNENSPERHLSVTVRGDRGTRHVIRLIEGEACSWGWQWESEVNGDPESSEWENKILSVLTKNRRELSLREINELCLLPQGDRKLYRPINNLIKRSRVTVRKDANNSRLFWYSLPGVAHTLPPDTANVCNQDGARVAHDEPVFSDSANALDSHPSSLDTDKKEQEFSTTEIESTQLMATSTLKNGVNACNPVTPTVAQIGGHGGECVSKAEERRSPWTEYNGVVQWRTDAKPVGKRLNRLEGTPTTCVATAEGMFEIGGSVTTSEIPGGGVFQIEKLTGSCAQLSMGHIVSVESLKPVGVKTA